MTDKDNGGRTHEPKLREVTADLDGLRQLTMARLDAVEKLATERDKWYSERDRDRQKEVERALTAAKDQTTSSFTASEKAIQKAEEAQTTYNQTHNDLTRKMDQQNKDTMPRMEIEGRFKTVEDKINDLRETRSESSGSRNQMVWIIGIAVALMGVVATVAAVVVAEIIRGRI